MDTTSKNVYNLTSLYSKLYQLRKSKSISVAQKFIQLNTIQELYDGNFGGNK